MPYDTRVNKTEINRLTKAIAAEEQNINLAFQRMGQTYFAAHRNDPEDSQKASIQAVLDAMQRASAYKDQINVLRGIAICPNCKAEVDITAAFCSHCGGRMPVQAPPVQQAAPNAAACPNCGNVCTPGTRFCNLCGTRLPEPGPAPAYPPAPGYAPAPNYAPMNTPGPGYAPVPESVPTYAPVSEPTPSYSPIPEPIFQAPPSPAQPQVFNAPAEGPAAPPPEPAPEPAPVSESAPAPEPVPESTPAPEPEPASEPVPEQTEAPRKFCANCGTPLDPDYRFCLECGTPVPQ